MPDIKVSEVTSLYSDIEQHWAEWRIEAEEDYRFYLGQQWDKDDILALPEGYPPLNLNIIKKPVDLISGYQRQNRTDLKVYGIEKGDDDVADIHTQLIKFTLSRGVHTQNWSEACHDALVCGIGWVHPYISYSSDPLNGDIIIQKEDPFKMFIDPYFKAIDLSDASFVIRRAYITKDQAKALWPDRTKEIDEAPGEQEKIATTFMKRSFGQYDNMLNITEKWYRVKKMKTIIIDTENNNMQVVDNDEAERVIAELEQLQPGRIMVFKKEVSAIKMIAVTDNFLLYDGDNPYDTGFRYPFVPVFGHYVSAFPELKLRHQGMVRKYKDIQKEKNKWHAAAVYTILTKNLMGYLVEEGVDISPRAVEGGITWIRVNDGTISGNKIKEIPPPIFPATHVQMEQLSDNMALRIGENADMLGTSELQGGSGSSAPGVTLQLRQRQGMTANQELTDHMASAYIMLGNIHIDLVNKNYTREKVERILGQNIKYQRMKKEIELQLRMLGAGQ